MTFSPEQIAALAQAERGRTEASKAAARVVWKIDQGKPRTAKQLSAELAYYGVNLSEESVRRLRYVARLLHALDREHLDPERLRPIHDLDLLYKLGRAAEVTHTAPLALLDKLEKDAPADARLYLAAMIKAKSAQATPESREAWKPALPRVPLSVANQINKAFGAYAKAHDLTPLLAAQELPALLTRETLLTSELRAWAARQGLSEQDAPGVLVAVLRTLPPEHWDTLIRLCPLPDVQDN